MIPRNVLLSHEITRAITLSEHVGGVFPGFGGDTCTYISYHGSDRVQFVMRSTIVESEQHSVPEFRLTCNLTTLEKVSSVILRCAIGTVPVLRSLDIFGNCHCAFCRLRQTDDLPTVYKFETDADGFRIGPIRMTRGDREFLFEGGESLDDELHDQINAALR